MKAAIFKKNGYWWVTHNDFRYGGWCFISFTEALQYLPGWMRENSI